MTIGWNLKLSKSNYECLNKKKKTDKDGERGGEGRFSLSLST